MAIKLRYSIWYKLFKILGPKTVYREPPTPKKVLFLCHPGVGDLILTTPVFSAFKNKFPNAIIDVVAGKRGHLILERNPAIRNVTTSLSTQFTFKELSFIKKIRNQNYDYIIDLCDWASPPRLLKIKLLGKAYKLRLRNKEVEAKRDMAENWNVYDKIVEADEKKHFSLYQREILNFFNIKNIDGKYKVYLSNKRVTEEIKNLNLKKPTLFFNFGGSREGNSLSFEQALFTMKATLSILPDANIIFNPFNIRWFDKHEENIKELFNNIFFLKKADIQTIVEWIRHSDLVISSDTGAVHIATALNIKQIILYLSNSISTLRFMPLYGDYKYILLQENSIENLKSLPSKLSQLLHQS